MDAKLMIASHHPFGGEPALEKRRIALQAAVVALVITTSWFALTWRYGFDLADEGFFWYGAQRTLQGEVPLLDFMSYDIGRYYWTAGVMSLLGNGGIFEARLAAAGFQFIGVFTGTALCLIAFGSTGRFQAWAFAGLSAATLTTWIQPYYKSFDHSASVIVVALLYIQLRWVSRPAHFFVGVGIGAIAIIGRNHGLYGFVASHLVLAYLLITLPNRANTLRIHLAFLLGTIAGFLPTFTIAAWKPEFVWAFVESLWMMVSHGATNISLPVPWPWVGWKSEIGLKLNLLGSLTGLGFIYLIVFSAVGSAVVIYSIAVVRSGRTQMPALPAFSNPNIPAKQPRCDPWGVFCAALAATWPYLHYAYSRADLTHLSLAIFPPLIGTLAASAGSVSIRALTTGIAALAISLLTFAEVSPFLHHHFLSPGSQAKHLVSGHHLLMQKGVASNLRGIEAAMQSTSTGGIVSSFLAIPNMPGYHAMIGQQMAVWEIYPLVPRSKSFEAREIQRLNISPPDVILFSDHSLDGNVAYRLSQMRPMTVRWIRQGYCLASVVNGSSIQVLLRIASHRDQDHQTNAYDHDFVQCRR